MEKENSIPSNAHVVPVQIKSIKRCGKEPVYCLAALSNGNMIANGIITKNCDALRYVVATHKVAEYKPYNDTHSPDQYGFGRFNPGPRRF